MREERGFPFWDFLQNNSAYGALCDSYFSRPFQDLLIIAFEFRHQIDLHLKSQNISSELSERKEALFGCMEFILSHVEETYASDVQAAFDEFQKAHQNDEPIFSLQDLNAGLNYFLESVLELERNSPPLPTQKQQAPFSFSLFLEERFSGLVSAIGQDQRLTIEDRRALSFFILVLGRDSVDQTIDLTNKGVFGPQGIQNPDSVVSQYRDALRGAYAVYMGELSLAHGPSADR